MRKNKNKKKKECSLPQPQPLYIADIIKLSISFKLEG